MNTFWTNFTIDCLLVVYVFDCLFMWLVIMMQRSKQEGLGAAFGGGITESVFGAQTSNVLVKATVWATIIFFVVSISLARLYSHRTALEGTASSVQQELSKPVAPVKAITPVFAPTNSVSEPAAPATTPSVPSTWAAPTTPSAQPPATPAKADKK